MYSLCTYSIFKWKQTAVFLLNLDQKDIKPTQNSRSSSLTKGNGTMGTIRTCNIHPQLQVAAIACRRILTMQYHSVEGNTTKKWEVQGNKQHACIQHTHKRVQFKFSSQLLFLSTTISGGGNWGPHGNSNKVPEYK